MKEGVEKLPQTCALGEKRGLKLSKLKSWVKKMYTSTTYARDEEARKGKLSKLKSEEHELSSI